jgi:hypothetical protein
LHSRSIHFLKALGFIDPQRAKAKAFDRLVDRLFLFSEVQAVAVHGFANSRDAGTSESAVEIRVMTWKPPNQSLQNDIDKILFDINRRYDTTMRAVVVFRNSSDSGLDSRPARRFATQLR